MARKSVGLVLFVIILGAMIGTLLGELIGLMLPEGVAKEFFLKSGEFGLKPSKLDVKMFTITLGFDFKLNIVGLLGLGIAVYLIRLRSLWD